MFIDKLSTQKVSWPLLIVPVLLIAIYSMLSIYSFTDPQGFYEVMEIPFAEHQFFIQSWAGKNTAMLSVLIMAALVRRRLLIYVSLIMLLVGQFGDALAGFRTDVNVFITYVALALVVIEFILLAVIKDKSSEA